MNVTENDNECIIDRGDIKCVIDKHTGKVLNLDEILDKFDYNLDDVKIDINAPVGFDEILAVIDESRVLGFLLECYKTYSQKECVKKYNTLKHQMEREREEFYLEKDNMEQQNEEKLQSVIQNQSLLINELTDQLRRYKDIPPELLNATGDDLRDFYRYMLTITREINDVFTLVLELNQFINDVIVPTIYEDVGSLEDRIKEFEEMRDHAIKLAKELRNKIHARKGRKLYKLVHEQYEFMVDKIIGAVMTYAVLVRTMYGLKHDDQVNDRQVTFMREELSRQISDTLERMKSFSERNLDEDLEQEKIYAIHQLAAIVYNIIGNREEVDEDVEGNTTRTQETPSLIELTELLEGYYTDREGMTARTFSLLKSIIKTVTSLRPKTEDEVRVEGDGLNGIYGTLMSLQRSLRRFLNDRNANPQTLRKEIERCNESMERLQETTAERNEQFMQHALEQEKVINNLKEQLEDSQRLIAEMEEEKGNIQAELQNAQAQCDALSREREALTSQLQELTATLARITAELEAARGQNEKLTKEKAELERELEGSKYNEEFLNEQLQEKYEEITRLTADMAKLNAQFENINIDLKLAKEEKDRVSIQLEKSQELVHDLHEKQNGLEHQVKALTKANNDLEFQITHLQETNQRNETANARSNKAISIILQQLHDKCKLLHGSLEGKDVDFRFVNIDENGLNDTVRSQIKIIKEIYILIAQYKNHARERIRDLNHQLSEAEQMYNERLASMSRVIIDRENQINDLLNVLKSIVTSSRSLINEFNTLPGSTSTFISDDGNINISEAPIDKIIKKSTELFETVSNNVGQLMDEYKAMISASKEKEKDRDDFIEKAKANFASMRELCIDLIRADKVANETSFNDLKNLLNNLREVYSEIDASVQQPDFKELDNADEFIKKLEDRGLLDLDITGNMVDKLEEVKRICNKSRETYSQMRRTFIHVYLQYVTTMVDFSHKSLVEAKERLSKKTAELKKQRANAEQNKLKSEQEIQRLKDELEKLHANAEQNKLKSEQEIQRLKDELEKCREVNKELSELNEELKKMKAHYSQKETESRNKILELEQQLSEYQEIIRKANLTKESLKKKKQEHQQAIEALKEEIRNQKETEKELKAQNQEARDTLQQTIQNKTTENENLTAKVTELNLLIETLKAEVKGCKQAGEALQSQLEEREKKLKRIESDNVKLTELNKQAEEEKDRLEQDLQALRKKSEDSKESYDSTIDRLQALIASNESEFQKMNVEKQQLQRELDDSHEQRKELSEKNEEQATTIATIRQLIEEQKKALDQCKEENETVTKEAQQKQDNDMAQITTLTAENAKLSKDVRDQKKNIKKQLAKMKQLAKSLQRSEKESTDAKAKLKDLDGEIEKLKAETQSLQIANTDYAQNIDELRESLEKRAQEITFKDEQIRKLSVDAANVQEKRKELQEEKDRFKKAAEDLAKQNSSICQPEDFAQVFKAINAVMGITDERTLIKASEIPKKLGKGIVDLIGFYEKKLGLLNRKMSVSDSIIEVLNNFTIKSITPYDTNRKKEWKNDRKISGRLLLGVKRIGELQIAIEAEKIRFEKTHENDTNPEVKRYKNFLVAFKKFCAELYNLKADMHAVSIKALENSTRLAEHFKSEFGYDPITAKSEKDTIKSLTKDIVTQNESFKREIITLRNTIAPYREYVTELLSVVATSDSTASVQMRAKLGAIIENIPDEAIKNALETMSDYFLSMTQNCARDRCNVMITEFNRIMKEYGINIPILVPNSSYIFKKEAVSHLKLAQTMVNAFTSLGLNPLMSNMHVFRDNDSLLFYAMCLCKNKMLMKMLLGDAFKMHFVEKGEAVSFDRLLQERVEIKPLILNMSIYNRLQEDGLDEFLETNFMKQLLWCIPEQEFTMFCNSVFLIISKTETHGSTPQARNKLEGVTHVSIPRTSRNPSPEGPMFIPRNTGTSDGLPTTPDTFRPINIDISACTASIPPKSIPIFDAVSCLETVFNDHNDEFADLQKLTSSHALLVKQADPKSPAESINGEFYGKECTFDISDACNVKISLQPEDKREIIWDTMMKKSNDVIKIFGKNVDGIIVLIPFVDYIAAINQGLQRIRLGTLDVKKCDTATFIARRNTLFSTILIGIVTHLIRSNYNVENVEPLLSAREIIPSEDEGTIYLETITKLNQVIKSPKPDHALSFANYDNGNGSILVDKSICGEMEQSWNIMNAIASDSLRSSICSREYYRALSEQSDRYGRKMTAFTAQGIMPMPMIEFGSVPLQPWNCTEAVMNSSTHCCTVASVFFPHKSDYKTLFKVGKFLTSSLQNIRNTKELEGVTLNLLKELEFPARIEARQLKSKAIETIDQSKFKGLYARFIELFTIKESDTFKVLFETNKEVFMQTCGKLENKNKERPVEEEVAESLTSKKSEREPVKAPGLNATGVERSLDTTKRWNELIKEARKTVAEEQERKAPSTTSASKARSGRRNSTSAKGKQISGKSLPYKGGALTGSNNGYLWMIFIVALILVLAVFVYMLARNYTTTREQFTPSPPISKNIAHVYTREAPLNYYFPVNHH